MNLLRNKTVAFSAFGLCATVVPAFAQQNAGEPKRPNIVFIMSDDHACQAISAYGHGLNKTPNIDRIAKEGAIFTREFCTNSLCAPARAVILTGKFSHMNGKIDNRTPFEGNQQTFPKLLRNAGYQTAIVGKWHLMNDPQGFDYWNIVPGQGHYFNPDFIEMGEKKQVEGYATSLITKYSLDWIEKRDRSKPFCIMIFHKAPHRNWLPEEKYQNLYRDKNFPLPDTFYDDYTGRGTAAHKQEMQIVRDMRWGHDMKFEKDPYTGQQTDFKDISRFTPEQLKTWRKNYNPQNEAFIRDRPEGRELAEWKYQRYMRDYMACIQSVDDGVGEVLDYLNKNGLDKNTIVVYTSDQGFYLGEHGWFDKRFMYQESFRTPLMMKYPKEIKPGRVIDKMVQNIDFAPTILDYAGVSIPADMQGESIREVATGKNVKNWRDVVYYHYYEFPAEHAVRKHYGIQTDRYKLIHFYGDVDEWELYDLKKDPEEMRSVYDDPEYKKVCEEMHVKLKEIRQKYKDED